MTRGRCDSDLPAGVARGRRAVAVLLRLEGLVWPDGDVLPARLQRVDVRHRLSVQGRQPETRDAQTDAFFSDERGSSKESLAFALASNIPPSFPNTNISWKIIPVEACWMDFRLNELCGGLTRDSSSASRPTRSRGCCPSRTSSGAA